MDGGRSGRRDCQVVAASILPTGGRQTTEQLGLLRLQSGQQYSLGKPLLVIFPVCQELDMLLGGRQELLVQSLVGQGLQSLLGNRSMDRRLSHTIFHYHKTLGGHF